jgi:hypothetical protein
LCSLFTFFDPKPREVLANRILQSADNLLSIAACRQQGTLKHLVTTRVEAREAQVFELPKDLIEA